ncbi:amidohydrolase family protein [Streptomyces sp. PmtG]
MRHPGRFWVYIGVDPRRGPEGVSAFERMVDAYGLDGVKLYPPCGYSPSDPGMYPYYEICAARSLPVFVHTGPTARSLDYEPAHPMNVDRAARDFPAVDFVLGHGGLTHVETCAYLAAYRPNVYLDTGGFASAPSLSAWPEHLNRLFRLGVNHKIVFGHGLAARPAQRRAQGPGLRGRRRTDGLRGGVREGPGPAAAREPAARPRAGQPPGRVRHGERRTSAGRRDSGGPAGQ